MDVINHKAFAALGAYPIIQSAIAITILLGALYLVMHATRDKPPPLPPALGLPSPAWLRAFLAAHADEITTVFFDIAGPHPLQATPADLVAALDA